MIGLSYLRSSLARLRNSLGREDRAAQLVEFAVSLPLLVVFVVGIFDFSGAFTLKQKLTNIARDAARAAAADPASDLQSTVPVSVYDAFQVMDNDLVANQINDCGITAPSSPVGTSLTWKSTGTGNGCPSGGLIFTINRGYYFASNVTSSPAPVNCQPTQTISGSQTAVIATCVSLQYAYQWKFGRVASLLGKSITLPSTLTASAIALNEN